MAHGMPRLDLLRATGEPPPATARLLGPRPDRCPRTARCELALRARLGRRRASVTAELADASPWRQRRRSRCPARRTWRSAWRRTSRRSSCSAARSSRSARRPTRTGCASSATTARGPGTIAAMRGGARRRRALRALALGPRRRGFYATSSARWRSRRPAPATSRMADQDDAWHPDKLDDAASAAIGDAKLVYSDQRIIAEDGSLIAETYWGGARNNHTSLLSLLVANAVTGAASLFPRVAARRRAAVPARPVRALPRPLDRAHRARARRDRFVDRPLYDYVQHGDATLGHADANRMTGLRDRLTSARRGPRERIRLWRMHYFVDVCRLLQFATVLQLRCGDRMRRAQAARRWRGSRAPSVAAARSRGLALRGARELVAPAARDAGRRVDALARARLAPCCSRPPRATGRSAACGSTPSRRRCSTRGRAPARPATRSCAQSPRRSRRCGSRSATTRRRASTS